MTPLLVVQNNHVVRLTEPVAKAALARGIAVHDVSSGDQVARRPLPPEGGPWGPILLIEYNPIHSSGWYGLSG